MHKYILLIFSISIVGCEYDNSYFSEINKLQFKDKNPTSYLFHASLNQIRDRVKGSLPPESEGDEEYFYSLNFVDEFRGDTFHILFHPETIENPLFAKNIFKDSANVNDIYLHSFGSASLSQIYFIDGRPVHYQAGYHLHLTAVTDSTSLVNVNVINPHVTRCEFLFGGHGFGVKEDLLEPTTIEEYKLLLYIGYLLNERNMPQLKLPMSRYAP